MSDLDNLKRQLSYTFLDAYGNFDGADILFDSIVKATEERIIKLLEQHIGFGDSEWDADVKAVIALIKGEK